MDVFTVLPPEGLPKSSRFVHRSVLATGWSSDDLIFLQKERFGNCEAQRFCRSEAAGRRADTIACRR